MLPPDPVELAMAVHSHIAPAAGRGAGRPARVAAPEALSANLTATMRGTSLPRPSLTGVCALALAAATAAFGCHSDPVKSDTSDAEFYSCAEETRAIPYSKGMTLDSSGGVFALTVLDSTFEDENGVPRSQAPAKGTNAWTVRITDVATAVPLAGATFEVKPRMPDHPNHATLEVGIMPLEPGSYYLKPLYLWMAGLWNVKFEIQRSAEAAGAGGAAGSAPAPETATFPICIPG